MIKIFGDIESGNCYKIKLLALLLGLEHEWHHIDILAGETSTPLFTSMNLNGKIPVLEIAPQVYLCESNAILNYLAEGSRFLPAQRLLKARVLQWQFFEQYSHEPYIAVARFIAKYLGLPAERAQEYLAKQDGGNRALRVMERQLEESDFLTGNDYTIADMSLYAYTHVAADGGFDLGLYPAISRWLQRIEKFPGHQTMAQLVALKSSR